MTGRVLTETQLRRRDNATQLIRQDATRPGTVNPIGYANARRILTDEFGYTNGNIMAIRRNARRAAR